MRFRKRVSAGNGWEAGSMPPPPPRPMGLPDARPVQRIELSLSPATIEAIGHAVATSLREGDAK